MIKIILIRHGQSVWNKENKFTGWTDVELSEEGIKEAHSAGKLLKENGFNFDLGFTSVLKRSIDTLDIILSEMNEKDIEIKRSWRLNERHYGDLQGKYKNDKSYTEEQIKIWRRSYDVRPPALNPSDERIPHKDPKYSKLPEYLLPYTESLKDTMVRVVEYWSSDIVPELKKGKNIIISAHGNSLRGLIKYLDNIRDEDIINLEIETGKPICYELDNNLKPIKHYYIN